jgi:hypothetical protein
MYDSDISHRNSELKNGELTLGLTTETPVALFAHLLPRDTVLGKV